MPTEDVADRKFFNAVHGSAPEARDYNRRCNKTNIKLIFPATPSPVTIQAKLGQYIAVPPSNPCQSFLSYSSLFKHSLLLTGFWGFGVLGFWGKITNNLI